jgi:riboflavin synthase alpha subunit
MNTGFIRVHHYNSKMFLLEFELKPLATTFYSTKRGASSTRLSDSFVLQEGEEIEFEEGFKVEIIELVLESTTVSYVRADSLIAIEIDGVTR